MRIAALNLGHRALKPKSVPQGLLDALVGLQADVLFLNEYVDTPEYRRELHNRWRSVCGTPQLRYNDAGRWSNQVVAVSNEALTPLGGLDPVPTQCASTNFLSVELGSAIITGIRAPSYTRAADWYTYWTQLSARLDGDVVIGDFNVDPGRDRKRDRVLPSGWRVVSPAGTSFRSTSRDAASAIDHALVRPDLEVAAARYETDFLHQWGLDHAPIVLDVDLRGRERHGGIDATD